MTWYRYKPGMLRPYKGLSDAEIGRFLRQMDEALAYEERGVNELADAMMEERLGFIDKRRQAASSRWGKDALAMQVHSTSNASAKHKQSKCNALAMHDMSVEDNTDNTDKTDKTYKPDKPTNARAGARESGAKAPKVGKSGLALEGEGPAKTPSGPVEALVELVEANGPADDYERLAGTPDDKLSMFAAWYCRDADATRAIAEYERAIAEMGHDAFRIMLDELIGDIRAGETPRNRGAFFMARVMKRLKAIRERRNHGDA